jgi:hypothetical protein
MMFVRAVVEWSLDRINRIYKIMNIDEICYKVIGAAMAVHRHFGAISLQHKHKYRVYRDPNTLNPVNPVNPV